MAELASTARGRGGDGGCGVTVARLRLRSASERERKQKRDTRERERARGSGVLRGDAWRRPGHRGRRQPGRRWLGRVCTRGEHALCLLAWGGRRQGRWRWAGPARATVLVRTVGCQVSGPGAGLSLSVNSVIVFYFCSLFLIQF